MVFSHHFKKQFSKTIEKPHGKCDFLRPHFHSQEKENFAPPLGINLDMLTLHNSYNHSTITTSFDDLFGHFDTPKRMGNDRGDTPAAERLASSDGVRKKVA